MQDLISRKAALDAIESTDWYHQNRNKDMVSGANSDDHQAWYKAEDIYKAIDDLPSAQLERKRGRWIDGKATHIKTGEERAVRQCSQCGAGYFRYDISENTDPDIPNFCPNCGSDNRGIKDGNE